MTIKDHCLFSSSILSFPKRAVSKVLHILYICHRNDVWVFICCENSILFQLQGFSAAYNNLDDVNQTLFSNKNLLKWIDLTGNRLTNADFLSMCSLKRLEEVYLSYNRIPYLPLDSFQATNTLSIFAIDNNLLQTLPRCALLRFYPRMQHFDISNNPMQCNCSLSWLQSPHDISTDRHSECANIEFTTTDTYQTHQCGDPPACLTNNSCDPAMSYKYVDYESLTSLANIKLEHKTLVSENPSAGYREAASLTIVILSAYSAILFPSWRLQTGWRCMCSV